MDRKLAIPSLMLAAFMCGMSATPCEAAGGIAGQLAKLRWIQGGPSAGESLEGKILLLEFWGST